MGRTFDLETEEKIKSAMEQGFSHKEIADGMKIPIRKIWDFAKTNMDSICTKRQRVYFYIDGNPELRAKEIAELAQCSYIYAHNLIKWSRVSQEYARRTRAYI